MIKQLHNEIRSEYEKRQKEALSTLQSRKSHIYEAIPRIKELDSQIQLTGIKYNKMILQGLSPFDEAVGSLFQAIELLKKEKLELLTSRGYADDYLEAVYACPACRDTGFVDKDNIIEKCTCYRQQLIDKIHNHSNLKLTSTENFTTFNEGLFPGVVDENKYGIKVSPRENIQNVREHCIKFIENFESPEEKSLFFSGPAGTGKTFMSNCIAMEIINRGFTVLYQTAPVLFSTINEYRMKAFKDDEFEDMGYNSIFEVDLLIIDDLGTESPSAARYAELLNILNTRHSNNFSRPCKTVISSNLGIKHLYEYYTERVASRIVGNFNMYRLAGEDIRALKKFNGL